MPRRLTRRPQPDPDPEEPEEQEGVEDDEEGLEPAFAKILDQIESIETNELLGKYALCQALVEHIGEAGANGVNNGSGDQFEELAEWLRDRGIEDYGARTLRDLRSIGEHFTAADWSAAEEAGVSFTTIYVLRCHPEVFRDLLACLDGKRPGSLGGRKAMYRGEEVSLAVAVRRRGKITKSDAQIALGQPHAADRSAASSNGGQSATDLTREERIQELREEIMDPDLRAEVMEDDQVRDAVYQASRAAIVKASGEDPSYSAEKPRPRGGVAKMSITASSGKAKLAVDDWVADLRRVAEVDHNTRDFVHATTHEIRVRCDEADSLADGGSVADEASSYLKEEQ